MRTYTAYVTDKNSKQSYFITADDYSNKKAFAEDLRRNGYAVHYIATPYTIDAVSDSYNKRREYRNEVARNTRAAAKAHREAVAEMTTEEPTQEVQTMRASREFFTLEEKTRKADNHYNIVADSDTEYYVSNAPSTKEAVKLAMTKYAKKLESIGTPAAALLASTVRDYLKYEYFTPECGYNYSGNGGGAFDICIDDYNDGTMCVYLRVAEILEEGEEPEEAEEENQEEEKPALNETDSVFIAEMVEALKYFKRVLWSYTDGTRYERDISGDFWGAHECGVILSFVNNRLKAQGAEPYYKLKNDFDSLTECFEEIMQKFEYGDERTIEEIIAEYNFY